MDGEKERRLFQALRVREDAFKDHKGRPRKGMRKFQGKILGRMEGILKGVLEPGEEILLVMPAVSPLSFMEAFTAGSGMAALLKRAVLVLTDRRLVHLPAKYDYSSRDSVAQVRFGDIAGWKIKGRRLHLAYNNGAKEKFLLTKFHKKLKVLLETGNFPLEPQTPWKGRHHLCPACLAPLQAGVYRCQACRLEFREPGRARLLSILLPGGGYFYTRHPWMGTFDALVETYLIAMVVFLGFMARQEGEGWGAVILLGAVLVYEKIITIFHASHFVEEFIPEEKEVRRQVPRS